MTCRIHRTLAVLGALVLLGGRTTTAGAQETNRYAAPFASSTPAIDGVVDPIWAAADWDTLSYNYLAGTAMPSASDLSARYKALWDADRLYILMEVVDDSISDRTANPLQSWWNDEALEIFLDENHDGGDHQYNFSAWAYHISILYDVVDYGDDEKPHLFNDHVEVRRLQNGHTSIWEMAVKVYVASYDMAGTNTPVTLVAPKTMGFSLALCDNDGKTTRESFIGSVDTPGHLNNEGYLDASVFGTIDLLPAGSAITPRPPKTQSFDRRPDSFRLHSPTPLRISSLDGSLHRALQATPDTWIGADLPSGTYLVTTPDHSLEFRFTRP